MNHDFLFVLALPGESQGLIETLGYPVIYTGVGKVNAATYLSKALSWSIYHEKKPICVINLGTAGCATIPYAEVVQVRRFIQRDMLCERLKANKFCTPYEQDKGYINVETYSKDLYQVKCGTGDSFMGENDFTTHDISHFEIADMEGYALAKVCRANQTRFISLKYISDSGNSEDWEANLKRGAELLYKYAKEALDILERLKH